MLTWKRRRREDPAIVPAAVDAPCEPASPPPQRALSERDALFLQRLREGHYDFVDLGTCDGGGFEIARHQGGRRGLGFDLEPHAVARGRAKGLDVALYDVCDLETDAPCVDFAVCSHILEHLPDIGSVETVIGALAAICRDYILIFGPCFEEEDYLQGLGLKLLHSIQADHTCKFKVLDLVAILHRLRLRDYTIALVEPIADSSNHWIHDADEPWPPEGLWFYEAGKHRPKPHVGFDRAIHLDMLAVVPLRRGVDAQAVLDRFFRPCDRVVMRASWADRG